MIVELFMCDWILHASECEDVSTLQRHPQMGDFKGASLPHTLSFWLVCGALKAFFYLASTAYIPHVIPLRIRPVHIDIQRRKKKHNEYWKCDCWKWEAKEKIACDIINRYELDNPQLYKSFTGKWWWKWKYKHIRKSILYHSKSHTTEKIYSTSFFIQLFFSLIKSQYSALYSEDFQHTRLY